MGTIGNILKISLIGVLIGSCVNIISILGNTVVHERNPDI